MRVYMSVRDVAQALQVTENSVRRWILRGELGAFKVGPKYLVDPEEFSRFLGARAVEDANTNCNCNYKQTAN